MRFGHMADCHIGGWREDELKQLGMNVFSKAMDMCIERKLDFVMISGDLFNTALPSIDLLKETTAVLKKVRDDGIRVYVIPGSHDYSPSGKTMLDVLEKAGLIVNVMKFKDRKLQFLVDEKTGAKITGILGRKGGLEKRDYEELEKEHLEREKGFKIFMFHTAITEFKPEEMEKMESQAFASLPKNFDYYAGGHIHYIFDRKEGKSLVMFPGALFPNNFKELEEFGNGGFYVVDEDLSYEYVKVRLKDVIGFRFDAEGKTAEQLEGEIKEGLKGDFKDKIVLIRVEGTLESGKPGDINFKEIISGIKSFVTLKNTNKLGTKEFEEIKIDHNASIEDVEKKVIEEHLGQVKLEKADEKELVKELMRVLDEEKKEGEKTMDFEKRMIKELGKVIEGL